MVRATTIGTLVIFSQERIMAKGDTKKDAKNAQKAAPKQSDSEIRDLKSPEKKTEFGKVKGGGLKRAP